MIDFQNDMLDIEVYMLMTKMFEICSEETLPKYKTQKISENRWKCSLNIPGVLKEAIGYGETEIDSVNKCANCMLGILERNHKYNEYDPLVDDSYFRDYLEQWFGNIEYDENYNYYPGFCDINLNEWDTHTKEILMKYADSYLKKLENEDHYITKMCDIVSLRFLVKYRKNNLC